VYGQFCSAFYDGSSNLIHQSLRIYPFQYGKRPGGWNTEPGACREDNPCKINAVETDESVELTRSTGRDAKTDLLDTQVRGVHLLEAIAQSDELRHRPVEVLYPDCCGEVERHEDGFPSYVS